MSLEILVKSLGKKWKSFTFMFSGSYENRVFAEVYTGAV